MGQLELSVMPPGIVLQGFSVATVDRERLSLRPLLSRFCRTPHSLHYVEVE